MAERLYLVGMMGSGKTTVGRLVATKLGWTHVDSDDQVCRRTGRTVREIFETDGEAVFRIHETDALREAATDEPEGPAVVSVAGGAVLDDANRRLLADTGAVVWLHAPANVLAARVHAGTDHRPLLGGDDPEQTLHDLNDRRRPLYAELADLTVDAAERNPTQLADEIVAWYRERVTVITVPVDLGDRSYDVLVGAGARHRLLEVIPAGAQRAAIVTQPDLPVSVDPGIEHQTFLIDQGEDAKNLETIEQLCREFSRWGLTRNDVVVAVGGGVVTDAAGFAAAVYHRGVPVIHVATSLLAQVDAAIGGKTGVNLPEGKNLVGAFWQPAAVLCDTETLQTLPPREYRSGLGEIAKYHFLGAEDLADCNLDEKVARCVALKAAVVADDEREGGKRALLNYGHTLAHALETANEYDLRHGEAVAIGLVYAANLAHALGRIDAARIDDHRKVLASYDLPMALPSGSNADRLVQLMLRDKKATDGLAFVLDGPSGVEVVNGVSERAAADALRSMGAS